MKTSYLVNSQTKEDNNVSRFVNTTDDNTYENCIIANDASKKLDF